MRLRSMSRGLGFSLLVLMITAWPQASAWAAVPEKTLCISPGEPNAYSRSNLIFDTAGDLYGTTGGFNGAGDPASIPNGTVFEVLRKPGGGWTCKQIYAFQGGTDDGSVPIAGLTIDAAGNLYGTTDFGGTANCGVVFELSPEPGGTWNETILYDFIADSCGSASNLVFDNQGNLYGTTIGGGPGGDGTVFELSPNQDGTWREQLLYGFSGYDGNVPAAGITFDSAGNIFGTTEAGGLYDYGTVFELAPSPSGWSETTLHSFQNGTDGAAPIGGVTFDAEGNLFGTTNAGGNPPEGCCGTVFELTPNSDGTWAETIIYHFPRTGGEPRASVVFDAAGNLCGTTWAGHGAVFRLTLMPNGEWRPTAVYGFTGGRDGGNPYASVTLDAANHLYGTTYDGGNGYGVVFEIP